MRAILFKVTVLCLAIFVFGANYSPAEPEGKHSKLSLYNQIGGMTVLGLEHSPGQGAADTLELRYRYYFSDSDSIVFRNNHIGFGATNTLSPATNSIGAFIEFEPIAILNVRLQYDYLTYFGEFVGMLEFESPDEDYSARTLDERADNDEAVWAVGHCYSVNPTFQIMLGRFVAVNRSSFMWYDIIDKDNYFYNPVSDTLMKHKEYFFSNDAIVGFIPRKESDDKLLIVGTRYAYSYVHSTDRRRQQLGMVMVWMLGKKIWFMEKPRLTVAAMGYLEDQAPNGEEYRKDDLFVGGLFEFEHTLWSSE